MANAQDDVYDAVIVGSGAGGSMSAYVLTKAGARVLLLEAGRDYNPATAPMLNLNRDAPLRGMSVTEKPFSYYGATIGGWEIPEEPYTSADGSDFRWFRSRMLGGRTNHWGRNSFRMGPHDFKGKSRDGLGFDWPISYEDIAPWYDRTEKLIGVYGNNPNLENHPNSGPGVLHDPPKSRAWELFLKAGGDAMGIPVVPARRAVLTRDMDDRKACYYASDCTRGCAIGAAFQTTTSLLPWSRKTGKLTVQTGAMVFEVLLDSSGKKASGVRYIDKASGQQREAKGRVVVLAASTGETARILLNSKPSGRSEGLANSSGQVGRNLVDTIGSYVGGHFPDLENRPRYNEDGAMGLHVYIPFWLYKEQAAGKLNFPRGYHVETYGGFGEPHVQSFGGLDGYGSTLREQARKGYGANIALVQRGEPITNADTFAELDPEKKDAWGIPVLRFHHKWTEHDIKQVDHFQTVARELVERMGGKVTNERKSAAEMISKGGEIIHEVGTARMGSDPKESVTDSYGRTWDVDNLYLADGTVFTSKAHKNPTLTIMALAMRQGEHLSARMRRGEV